MDSERLTVDTDEVAEVAEEYLPEMTENLMAGMRSAQPGMAAVSQIIFTHGFHQITLNTWNETAEGFMEILAESTIRIDESIAVLTSALNDFKGTDGSNSDDIDREKPR